MTACDALDLLCERQDLGTVGTIHRAVEASLAVYTKRLRAILKGARPGDDPNGVAASLGVVALQLPGQEPAYLVFTGPHGNDRMQGTQAKVSGRIVYIYGAAFKDLMGQVNAFLVPERPRLLDRLLRAAIALANEDWTRSLITHEATHLLDNAKHPDHVDQMARRVRALGAAPSEGEKYTEYVGRNSEYNAHCTQAMGEALRTATRVWKGMRASLSFDTFRGIFRASFPPGYLEHVPEKWRRACYQRAYQAWDQWRVQPDAAPRKRTVRS